ncbi:MAG: hypothetical protein AB7O43_04515 [Hyphomicrobiaceae bacterium]
MSEQAPSESRTARARRVRDFASIVPFVAALLFLPPVILVFSAPVTLSGIPLIVVYLYGTWAALVLAAFLVVQYVDQDNGGTAEESDGT